MADDAKPEKRPVSATGCFTGRASRGSLGAYHAIPRPLAQFETLGGDLGRG